MTNPLTAATLGSLDRFGCGPKETGAVTTKLAANCTRLDSADYVLEEQVGFLIRRAHQRASSIFNDHFKDLGLSPVQFAALNKIADEGPVSQNQLGRLIHMDPATTMAMINRLCERDLVERQPDPIDRRRVLLSVRPRGQEMLAHAQQLGLSVSAQTLAPLAPRERKLFLGLLAKLI